jgi:hypothetical protein
VAGVDELLDVGAHDPKVLLAADQADLVKLGLDPGIADVGAHRAHLAKSVHAGESRAAFAGLLGPMRLDPAGNHLVGEFLRQLRIVIFDVAVICPQAVFGAEDEGLGCRAIGIPGPQSLPKGPVITVANR